MGFEAPIERDKTEMMNRLAGLLDHSVNPNMDAGQRPNGFVLMVFPFNRMGDDGPAPGRMNYISNANRDEVIAALEDQVQRLKELRDAAPKPN